MTGTLFAAKMTIISPSSFTFWDSVLLFAAVILGGGSLTGVILGAFLVFGLPEIFRDFAQGAHACVRSGPDDHDDHQTPGHPAPCAPAI